MLTFAGEPLLFPDAELMDWLERNQSLVDLSPFCDAEARVASARHACRSRFEQDKGLGLPVLNWPPAPPARLNTLYWPTGATRWARGWFLASGETKDAILEAIQQSENGSVQKGTLGIGDDDEGNPLGIDMWLLPPRPITKGDETDSDLWLIPLVDERYFWQFCDGGDIAVSSSTTWADLFTTLGASLGVTVQVSAVAAEYLKPDPVEFTRKFDNAALLLDAAAASCGRRIVRLVSGDVVAQSVDESGASLDGNLERDYSLLAGGDFSDETCDLPEKVRVTFRKIKQYLLRKDGQQYDVEHAAPDDVSFVSDKVLTIHSTCYADYDLTDTLTNSAALESLTEKIASDFYDWASTDYDYTFAGIQAWDLCGFDDAVLWIFGRPIASRTLKSHGQVSEDAVTVEGSAGIDLLAQTRVQTLPPNFWPELNACQDPDQTVVGPILMAKANSNITAGGSGMVSLYDAFTNDLLLDVQIDNITDATWQSGKRGLVAGMGDAAWLGIVPGGGATSGVPFVNGDDVDVPPYGVMWDSETSLVAGTNYVVVAEPDTTFDRFWLVNGGSTVTPDNPAAPDHPGTGNWLFETTGPVAIDPSSAADIHVGTELGPKPGSFLLFPYRTGFTALGDPYTLDGTLVVDCRQRDVSRVFGKFYTQLNQGSSAEFEIWLRGKDGKISPAGWDKITVYDFSLQKSENVKAGTKGRADWYSSYWEADPDCDVDNTDSAQQSPGANLDQSFALSQSALGTSPTAFISTGSTGTGIGTK